MNEPKPIAAEGCPEPLCDASLLRAAADGELGAAQRARLEAHLAAHPEDAGRIAFERQLRACCGRVLGAECCPGHVRAKVEAMCCQGVRAHDGGRERAPTRRRASWASPRALAGLAAVAAVGLLVGVGTILITGPGAGGDGAGGALALAGGHSGSSQTGSIQSVAYRDRVAQFVAREHTRCWENEGAAEAKFRLHDPAEVQAYFEGILGARIDLPAWHQPTESLIFRGAGRCSLPGTDGRTAHMRFDIPGQGGRPAAGVSLFVAPDNGEMPIEEGTTYAIKTGECGVPKSRILVWKETGMVFVLVSEAAGGCDRVRKAMNAPEVSGEY